MDDEQELQLACRRAATSDQGDTSGAEHSKAYDKGSTADEYLITNMWKATRILKVSPSASVKSRAMTIVAGAKAQSMHAHAPNTSFRHDREMFEIMRSTTLIQGRMLMIQAYLSW